MTQHCAPPLSTSRGQRLEPKTTKDFVVRQQLQGLERAGTVQDFLEAYAAALGRWQGVRERREG